MSVDSNNLEKFEAHRTRPWKRFILEYLLIASWRNSKLYANPANCSAIIRMSMLSGWFVRYLKLSVFD